MSLYNHRFKLDTAIRTEAGRLYRGRSHACHGHKLPDNAGYYNNWTTSQSLR